MITSNGKKIIVTTSWDDGHPFDFRLAELLNSYNIPGTFYVPMENYELPVITKREINILHSMGMEIGSHTVTHPVLTQIDEGQIIRELTESKEMLEDILGEQILSIGYPKGKFNPTICRLVEEAGYQLARGTVAFKTDLEFDPFCMPVSFQLFPHTRNIHIRHALREGNFGGVFDWCRFWRMENDLLELTKLVFDHVVMHGGIFHIWGHSWELEEYSLWEPLEKVLKYIANRSEVFYLTNYQVLEFID